MAGRFVHLRVHSEYSLYDSTIRVKKLVQAAADAGMPAVALTDQANTYALVKFYKTALGAGLKPILGADLWLENPDDQTAPFRVCALCINDDGYKNLRELVSRGYSQNQHFDKAIVRKEWLFEQSAGLILLSGGRDGDVGQRIIKGKL
ncbi:MAG: PHP domain-containing protein, partial [Pseudomonadota bacterium]|nr:PHP domain-containing protein [Pseudomonadota bacterium]